MAQPCDRQGLQRRQDAAADEANRGFQIQQAVEKALKVEETSGHPVAVAQQSNLENLATVRPATPERRGT